MICADGLKHCCYPILADVMVDYEGQVLITEIKANMQCSVCHVPPQERENLTKTWSPRTYESTWSQIEQQENNTIKQRNKVSGDWLHPQKCFAWEHRHVNIHAILLSDILHQLYKRIVTNLVGWLTKSIKENYKPKQMAKKKGHTEELKLGQTSNLIQLDKRFRNIPPFTSLKLFRHYSKVVQWSGNEQKAMVKQLITAAIPLLIQDAPETIYSARAILDFTMLAQYPSHNNETLSYMEDALYRLDKTKIAFENHCPIDVKLFRPTFNNPKFHAMTHFVKCNRDYGSAINYNTAHSEAAHQYLLEAFYGRTNKKEYESRIFKHDICHTNIIAMQDAILMAKVLDGSAKKNSLLLTRPIQSSRGYTVQ